MLENRDLIVPVEHHSRFFAESPVRMAWMRFRDFLATAAGWYLEKTGAPARLREFEFVDPETDETVYLSTTARFAVLSVGARRFYFDRLNGKYDGTSAPACLIPDGFEFRD
jgi:hypothetical protein